MLNNVTRHAVKQLCRDLGGPSNIEEGRGDGGECTGGEMG